MTFCKHCGATIGSHLGNSLNCPTRRGRFEAAEQTETPVAQPGTMSDQERCLIITRLEILRARLASCSEHELSVGEVDGWIADYKGKRS